MGRNNKKKGRGKGKPPSSSQISINTSLQNSSGPGNVQAGGKASGRGKSLYSRYKIATQSFRDGLESLLPPSVPLTTVSDLGSAAEFLLEESRKQSSSSTTEETATTSKKGPISVPYIRGEILANLNESIRLREAVASSYEEKEEDDDGHAYMIAMLQYCRYILKSCRKIQLATFAALKRSSTKLEDGKSKKNKEAGQFDALRPGEDSDPEDEDDQSEEAEPILRPQTPHREYLIQRDLIDGSYQWQAQSFVFQVKTLFEIVNEQFEKLKENLREIKIKHKNDRKSADTAMVLSTMQAAAAANMMIQEIKHVEESLKIECPVFRTFYHVLAILVFPDQIDTLNDLMSDPKVLVKHPTITVDFVAEMVEVGFRTPLHPKYFGIARTIDAYLLRAKIDRTHMPTVATLAHIIRSIAFIEIETEFVASMPDESVQEVRESCKEVLRIGKSSKDNINDMFEEMWGESTSGVNCILHTHSLLQSTTKLLATLGTRKRFAAAAPMGPLWNEERNRALGTSDACVDDLFFRIIFPEWVTKAQDGTYRYLSKGMLPKIFPWFREFIDCFERGDKPIPLSSSISVHAMLTGIVCLQGDGDILRIALACKNASRTFFEQIFNDVFESEHASLRTDRPEVKKQFRKRIECIEMVSRPIVDDQPMATELHAFWNPLAAGSFMLNLCYSESMFPGAAMLDRQHQAVTTMHLYHALRERNLVDEIPSLSKLDAILKDSKGIWGGGKPLQGSFVKNYFVGVGHPLTASAKAADLIRDSPYSLTKSMFGTIPEEKKADIEKELANKIQNMNLGDGPFIRYQLMYGFRGKLKRGIRKEERPVTAEEISLSYRYFINRDFEAAIDVASAGKISKAANHGGIQSTCVNQTNMLVEQMANEGRRLSINFLRLSVFLNEFLAKIPSHMGWEEDLEDFRSGFLSEWKCTDDHKRRDLLLTFIGDRVLGELDSEVDNDKCEESQKMAVLLQSFYGDETTFDPCFF